MGLEEEENEKMNFELTAVQRREVGCRYERCKGVWRVEPWSEFNAPCGRQGIKYRKLQCVWYGSRRPAGNVCKHQPRPAVIKVCKSPACQVTLSPSAAQHN